ncbi:type IV pili methyl-accepting chemotaxis transducer N-terminal domain-containing protein [Cupriavidus basilensis]|uniref:type IV pili methyl-accepting chemotaxis transducer N-terminal domain-containing protein n=1 Tax=Cupriavidus basilensis TaxID=68895 RepID=UPI0023E8472D|nr:type IV pili methyl-accepting chemotaxis transducer N-terminal domain-containing protein [Cupriavidus basilensis]MDF3888021.1 type IV pili methyl-accepting chemotaxis transducer N-terminal domain-containing protein [Cupriavidus basilensis]
MVDLTPPSPPASTVEQSFSPLPAQAVLPGLRHRLSTRIVSLSLGALLIVLAMISGTLWLSWQLEGAGAAINDAGSLRMRANRVAIELARAHAGERHQLDAQISGMDATLARLHQGDPARPLFLPDDPGIRAQLERVSQDWNQRIKPSALADLGVATGAAPAYPVALASFVDQVNRLVSMIEQENATKTTLLRLSQAGLAAMACMGTVAVIYLLYIWIILPVMRLQDGLQRMAAREFSLRLPVETRDEFGMLADGFNRMAGELEGLYHDLEARVAQKTAELARHNRDLAALYDMAAFLNMPNDNEALCRGFLERVMQQFDADGGSVRMIDADHDQLHLVVSAGYSAALEEAEHCMKVDACFCGEAASESVVLIEDLGKGAALSAGRPASDARFGCAREGFPGLAVFRIETQRTVLGTFSLHFRHPLRLPASDIRLLETFGQHLGVALDHLHLSETARQLAVVEERNLVAQGLHDSIAQGLNYLNLQVQLLEDAVSRSDMDETRAIVPLLRCGVEESYQDVRELLLNFRSKLAHGELRQAVEDTVARFRRQSSTALALAFNDAQGGPPLQPEQQLQVLFILQEALSNVRKHARAGHASVIVRNGRTFSMVVEDDGDGFDPTEPAADDQAHVGLHIMRERAARLSASLRIVAARGTGTRVELILPR